MPNRILWRKEQEVEKQHFCYQHRKVYLKRDCLAERFHSKARKWTLLFTANPANSTIKSLILFIHKILLLTSVIKYPTTLPKWNEKKN